MINQHSPDTGADDVSMYVKPHRRFSFNMQLHRGLYNHGV